MTHVPDPIDDLERRLSAVERELGIVKSDIVDRYTHLNLTIAQGFADILQEIRAGFGQVDQRFVQVEARLSAVETILRERGSNGQAQP